jgi:6-pyruvoyltetrahydropterin/6-carboxytetrahydropterin synthase
VSFELERSYRFEAAHRLPEVPPQHRCWQLHGHSYEIAVGVTGNLDAQGWVCDFAAIDAAVEPLVTILDHCYLNEIAGLENPTSELLAQWLWERLKPELPGLCAVAVGETVGSRVTYRGQ